MRCMTSSRPLETDVGVLLIDQCSRKSAELLNYNSRWIHIWCGKLVRFKCAISQAKSHHFWEYQVHRQLRMEAWTDNYKLPTLAASTQKIHIKLLYKLESMKEWFVETHSQLLVVSSYKQTKTATKRSQKSREQRCWGINLNLNPSRIHLEVVDFKD